MSTFTSVVSDKSQWGSTIKYVNPKIVAFVTLNEKAPHEEMKWDITVCWQQWLRLFHCSICLVFDNEIEVVLRDSTVYCLEPI